MKKYLVLLLLVICSKTYSQEYKESAGFRGGFSNGFTYQSFVEENNSCEFMLGFRNRGIQFTGMWESYMPVLLDYSTHLFMYWGYGGHVGYIKWYKYYQYDNYPDYFMTRQKSSPVLGIDGIAGIEYRIYKYPLVIGLDFKPFIELSGRNFININFYDFGLKAKYKF